MSEVKKKKICPIISILEKHPVACFEGECRLWVHLRKDTHDPNYILEYEGCGLVVNLPWKGKELMRKVGA